MIFPVIHFVVVVITITKTTMITIVQFLYHKKLNNEHIGEANEHYLL